MNHAGVFVQVLVIGLRQNLREARNRVRKEPKLKAFEIVFDINLKQIPVVERQSIQALSRDEIKQSPTKCCMGISSSPADFNS